MAEVQICLFGGEQDGYRTNIELRGKTPEMFYIWPVAEHHKISAKTGKARMVLADRLAVLAYRLIEPDPAETESGRIELRYLRHPEADKKLADPAV